MIMVNQKLCNIYSVTSYTKNTARSYWLLILRATMNTETHSPNANNNAHANSSFFSVFPKGQSNTNQDPCFSGTRTISIGLPNFKTHSPSPYNLSLLILEYAALIPALLFLRMPININKSTQKGSILLQNGAPMIWGKYVVNAVWFLLNSINTG